MRRIILGALVLILLYLILLFMGVFNDLNLGGGSGFDLSEDKAKEGFDIRRLKTGCSFRDCIRSIDEPEFVSASEAESEGVVDDDVVFGIDYMGVVRAYPQDILNSHEIVNDVIAGDPILVTFCPLCATSIAFERTLDVGGQRVVSEFGVSGKLVNSNLVMYDRETETLWQQLGGEAIVGDLVGQELTPVKIDTVLWKNWKKLHPDTEVLSRVGPDTRGINAYNSYPYGNYESDSSFIFSPEAEDDRLHPKQIVWGIKVNGEAKAYSDDALARDGTVTDVVGGQNIKVVRNPEGVVTFTNLTTNEEIVPDHSMWFAWFAFNQDTGLYN